MSNPTVNDYLTDALAMLRPIADLHRLNPESPDSDGDCTCFQCSRALNVRRCLQNAVRMLGGRAK